jgi:hypothetical protein
MLYALGQTTQLATLRTQRIRPAIPS